MLLQNIRAKVGARLSGESEAGFTLIELLVVMLIIGILAAIAIPTFFNQKNKAHDTSAKEEAHTAQVAMETCGTEHNGEYTKCGIPQLEAVESTLGKNENKLITATGSGQTWAITIKNESTKNTFSIKRGVNGELTYPCTGTVSGGCPAVEAPATESFWN